MYKTISSTKEKLHFQRVVVLPHAVSFLKLRTDVIRIQQLFAEAAASGGNYKQGMERAKKNYEEAIKEINYLIEEHVKYHKPEMVKLLKGIKQDLSSYYNLGRELVKNMKSSDETKEKAIIEKINRLADKLTSKLGILAEKHIKKSNSLSLYVEKSLKKLESISVISFFIIIIVVIVSFGAISYALKPIKDINSYIKRLANMDFTGKLDVSGKNEISEIGYNLVT